VDTGSEVSLVPFADVDGLPLQPSNRILLAANGTQIKVLGQIDAPIKISRGFSIDTSFLVSDQIGEPMLGMDWLRHHRCRLGFGQGALFVGRRRIPLVKGNGSLWCRRVMVAEETTVLPRSQCDIPCKTQYRDLTTSAQAWMTESKEIQPGLHVARVVLDDDADNACIRVVNLNEQPALLSADLMLGDLHPVMVEVRDENETQTGTTDDNSLVAKLMDEISEDVPADVKERLNELLVEYESIFSTTDHDLGRTMISQHRIDTGDSRPVRQSLRRQPLPYQAAIDAQLDQMLATGVVEPAASEWAANVVLAKKKDGSLRFCIDYRKLNNQTRKDSYPLPRIDACLDALSGAGWFSTLDLRSGYHQVMMNPGDSDKTAFITRRGTFRWRVMPFGLCNAPATFQRLMDIVLSGLNFELCLVYLDDVIIFSSTADQHLDRLGQVFARLKDANLKLKPSKCHLFRRTVSFLGHVVTAEGIAVDQSKVLAVTEWPTPRCLKEVRAFVGLCSYYRKFIRGFSLVAAPLFALTKKDQPFLWGDECQDAFDRLKDALTMAPVLSLPVDDAAYTLDCDASDVGIGGVLSQNIDGEERVIAYGSRLFSTAERNYCITRKELLAVVHFTQVFRQNLLGRRFTLRTDHAALRWLQHTPDPIGQQGRWLEKLAEFDFEILHRPGRKHGNADALSRKPCRQCHWEEAEAMDQFVREVTEVTTESDSTTEIVKSQKEDPVLSKVRSWLSEGMPSLQEILLEEEAVKVYWHQRDSLYLKDDAIYRRTPDEVEQVLVPKDLREDYLRLAHTGVTGGHLGVKRTRWQVRRRAYWVGWSGDVKRFCRHCDGCCRYRRGALQRQGPLQPMTCGEPWERVSVDVTGPHPRSRKGNIYILTMMDNFSKFAEAVPMANQEATTVAKALVETIVVRYGAPLQILTDQGRNFEGHVFQEMCRLLEVDKVRTSSYRPQSNGMIERYHRTLNSMLGKVVSENQRDWDEHLPYVTAAYRASIHDVTGFSPNYLIFGKENRAPLDLVYGPPEGTDESGLTYSTYANELSEKFVKAYGTARQSLKKNAERRKHNYDLRVRPAKFEEGDWVYYFSPRKFVGRSPKFQRNFTGPYRIVRACGPVNYLLQKSPKAKPFVSHVDKLRHCFGRTKGQWSETGTGMTNGPPAEAANGATASSSRRPGQRWKETPTTEGNRTSETGEDLHDGNLDGAAAPSGRPRRNVGRPVRFQ
jgi:transposase InsO family protein